MLLYHPVEDSSHCCYRLLRLLNAIDENEIPLINLRICDFYCLFPGRLKYIKGWPRRNSITWKNINLIRDEYEEMLNPQRVFFQLNTVQEAAISHLLAKNLIRISTDGDKKITMDKKAIPSDLLEMIESDVACTENWFAIIAQDLSKMEARGKRGLKSRSELMEFVYD